MDQVAPDLRFEVDPLTSEAVRDLVATHLRVMRSQSPACSVHALEVEGLQAADITFWSVWIGPSLAGCGALKELSPTEGEIKSMHVRAEWRGQKLGAQILTHIEATARARGMMRVSLETGSQDEFEPARRLYASFGYVECGPFGSYVPDPNSTFMTKALV
jgi:putative acetyltransferase